MSKDDYFAAGGFCLLCAVLALFMWGAWGFGTEDGEAKARKEAIEAGVGEWTIDAKTGKRSFRWKVCE